MHEHNNSKQRVLVIGFGSIGSRHSRILDKMGYDVSVVSRRPNIYPQAYLSIEAALLAGTYLYAVIANETSQHRAALVSLLKGGFKGKILVEKPLWSVVETTFSDSVENVYVGYDLRFHPVLLALHSEIREKELTSAEVRACSFLPGWRPNRDYRETESARLAAGGGVLRDLSHELDYVQWLFGGWKRVAALGGHLSSLEIETDDVSLILMQTENCPAVAISLNYIDRLQERWLIVNTTDATYRADLVTKQLFKSGKLIFQAPSHETDELYADQHRAVLNNPSSSSICTFREGLETVNLFTSIERAQKEGKWISK